MAAKSAAGLLTSVDSMFTTQEERDNAQRSYVIDLPTTEISDFPDHPFKVRMDEEMEQMVESVRERGVLSPVLVRPMSDGSYQMVSGHRRKMAAELAELPTVPCIVRELTDDEAVPVRLSLCGDGFASCRSGRFQRALFTAHAISSVSGMSLDFLKGFIAQIMLYLTGVRRRCLRGNTQLNENLCQQLVPVIDTLGNLLAGRQKRDISIIVHLNIAVLPKISHRYADTRLGKAQFMDNINGAHHSAILPEF